MLIPDPEQPRQMFEATEMAELKASIEARGIKQPLTVRWSVEHHKYMVIDGGRRFAAACEAGLTELPCWVQTTSGRDVLIDQIVHNWQRVNLRPIETANALARLRDEFGLNQQQLAEATGKPKSEISKLLAIHDHVDPDLQHLAASDNTETPLTKRHLYNLSKLSPSDQPAIVEQIQRDRLSAVATEQLVARATGKVKIHQSNLAARQRRYHTTHADVVMTFRKVGVTQEKLCQVIEELQTQLLRQ